MKVCRSNEALSKADHNGSTLASSLSSCSECLVTALINFLCFAAFAPPSSTTGSIAGKSQPKACYCHLKGGS